MNESKTINLGLNKIDRSSPSTTYFDLDKYLDQNWEKVDGFAGLVEEKVEDTVAHVSDIQDRLDAEKRRTLTLEPGLQIINAKRASAFKLEGIKGRTLVNLLGRDGGFTEASKWNIGFGTKTVANNVIKVTGNGTGLNPQLTSYNHILALTPKVGDKLFLRVRATHIVGTAKQLQLYLWSTTLNRFTAMNIDNPENGTTYDMYGVITVNQAIVDGWDANLGFKLTVEYASNEDSNGSQVQFSQAAVFKVSEADKLLSNDQLATKYPYVESVQPVRNPYAIRYGENLLPPFYEYAASNSNVLDMVKPYVANINFAAQSTYSVTVPVISGQRYTLALSHNGRIGVNTVDDSGNIVADLSQPKLNIWITDQSLTFTVPAGATKVKFNINNGEFLSQPLTFSNPMLTIGNVAKPFKPRDEVMLALQTDLFADPLTGDNADEVFEKDGQYFKLTKWRRIVPDGSFTYGYFTSYAGAKSIFFFGFIPKDRDMSVYPTVVKYDGKTLTPGAPSLYVDNYSTTNWLNLEAASLGISVSSEDSGWGDAYTPTADEIKACFMGWKMYDVMVSTSGQGTYNGSGAANKRWAYRTDGGSATYTGGTTTLPTTVAPNYTPYQLIYKLATPIVEPITSEGQLTLIEGANQIEIGTGIVLREPLKPVLTSDGYRYAHSRNGAGVGTPPTKYFVGKILQMFKNNKQDQWEIRTSALPTDYGISNARLPGDKFDSTAMYSFTYLAMDNYAPAIFVGLVSETEKALLAELIDNTQQSASMLAVFEKALKDVASQSQNKRNVWGRIG